MFALATNLISDYKLDTDSNDSVGSNNGADTSVSYANDGKISKCATLNGSSSKTILGVGTLSAALNGAAGVTFSCWVKVTAITGGYQVISSLKLKSSGSDEWNGFELYINPTTGAISVIGRSVYTDSAQIRNGSVIATGSWQHIVGVVDFVNKKIYLYINGISDGTPLTATFANTVWTDSASHSTGDSFGSSSNAGTFTNFLGGAIDEVAIWSRALTANEAYQLYNNGAGLKYPLIPTLDITATNNKDNNLRAGSPTLNLGSSDSEFLIYAESANKNRLILDFTLPAGVGTITAVKLFLYSSTTYGGSITANAHLITRSGWTELGSTWNTYDGTHNWTTAGGDYNSTVIAHTTVGDATGWKSWDLQGAGADNPLSLNWGDTFGILLKGSDESTTLKGADFWSRDYADSSKRPYIEVTYTTPSGSNASFLLNMI